MHTCCADPVTRVTVQQARCLFRGDIDLRSHKHLTGTQALNGLSPLQLLTTYDRSPSRLGAGSPQKQANNLSTTLVVRPPRGAYALDVANLTSLDSWQHTGLSRAQNDGGTSLLSVVSEPTAEGAVPWAAALAPASPVRRHGASAHARTAGHPLPPSALPIPTHWPMAPQPQRRRGARARRGGVPAFAPGGGGWGSGEGAGGCVRARVLGAREVQRGLGGGGDVRCVCCATRVSLFLGFPELQ